MALFYVLQKISIPNYPEKFFWVNLMHIGRALLVLSSRLKNGVNMHVSLCFSSMFIFTDCL